VPDKGDEEHLLHQGNLMLSYMSGSILNSEKGKLARSSTTYSYQYDRKVADFGPG
jgi:hypothetical protein